jgi:hypothetical protein
LIAAVAIGNVGSDQGRLAPMVEQLAARYGKPPGEMLVRRRARQAGRHRDGLGQRRDDGL